MLARHQLEAFSHRSPTIRALLAAPARLLDVTARARCHWETVGGVHRLCAGAVELSVTVRFTRYALASGAREGHANLGAAVGALLEAQAAAGVPVVAKEAKATGLCLPPRAARMGAAQLRTLRGQLDALEMEGTASTLPPPPSGLAANVVLGEYQNETLAWMLARERSRFGLEDLFETRVGDSTFCT